MVFALKGATLALHFYLFKFKLFNLSDPDASLDDMGCNFCDDRFSFLYLPSISHRVNFLW